MTVQTNLREQHIENLKFIRSDYDDDQWGQALDFALAALAPPSGEGVDRSQRNPAFVGEWHAKAVALGYDGVADMLDSVERGEPPQHIAAVLGATPQSAPVDGDAQQAFTAWFCLNYPGPHTIISDPNWHAPRIFRQAQWAIKNTTPPPASQERGGEQCKTCNGIGIVGGMRGQTPESMEQVTENCPDCSDDVTAGGTSISDEELPGMWEHSDFTGGATDAAEQASSAAEEVCSCFGTDICASCRRKQIARNKAVASPPSSAAAAKEPEQRCPYCAGLIYSAAGCQNCKVGSVWPKPIAAEQAKPEDDLETWRRGITERLLVATEKLTDKAEQAQAGEVCPFCGREGKHLGNEACQGLNNPTTFTLTNELPDLPEHAGTMEWTRQSGRLDIPELGYTADQMRDYANACRLAGGVTVDDAMVERALHASVPGGSEVWCWLPQLDAWKPATIAYEIVRAALVDALGAK